MKIIIEDRWNNTEKVFIKVYLINNKPWNKKL